MIIKTRQNLKKKEIVNNLKSTIGFSSKNLLKITDDIIDVIIDVLAKDKKLNIKNFGSFKILDKKERLGRNPKNKKKFIISSRKSISFLSAKKLNRAVNDY